MADLSEIEKSRIGKGMKLNGIFSAVTGKIEYNEGTERVNQSLELIFSISHNEVPMLPTIGSGLAEMLFEPADDILENNLEIYLRDAVEKLEPRMVIQDLTIDIVENYIYITIEYILTGTNIAGKFNYEITKSDKGDII